MGFNSGFKGLISLGICYTGLQQRVDCNQNYCVLRVAVGYQLPLSKTDDFLRLKKTLTLRVETHSSQTKQLDKSRLHLKRDGTRRRTGGEVKGKLVNGVGSQYPSRYLGTLCIQHYYR